MSVPGIDLDDDSDLGAWVEQGADPRGVRFTAAVTSIVLALGLVTGWWWVVADQALLFALCAVCGVQRSPVGALFRWTIARRLPAPAWREPIAPLRFAQAVGAVLAGAGAAADAAGWSGVGTPIVGLILIGAMLNAATGLCAGCRIYLAIARLRAPN